MEIFVKLGWFFKRERWNYLVGVLFLVLTAIAQVVTPKVIGNLVDAMNSRQLTIKLLSYFLTLLILSAVSQYFFRYMWRTKIWGGAARLEKLLRTRLFRHFMAMDTTFYQQNRTGDLMAHATNDLSAIQMVAGSGILTFADSIITGGATIIAMLTLIDWRLTLIAIIPLPFLAVMARFLGTRIHTAFKESQAAFSRLNNKTQESVMGIKVIKALGQEEEDIADFDHQVDQTIQINKRVNRLDALFDPLTTIIIGLSYVATIILGGYFVVHHIITIGQIVAFISYISMLIWPMFAIGRLFNVMERGNASYDRVQELLNEQTQIVDAPNGLTEAPSGTLDFQVQQFSYPDDPEIQLKNVNFRIQAGQTIGIVGRIGAGKTTILKLIMRQFDDYQGQIKYGDHDIKNYRLDSYLPAIGYVPQDSFLFSTTIRENIRFADPTLSDTGVQDAAVKSALHNDVMNLPDQYDTEVGEQGVSLSGGQKQRLAIARALVIDPELLILDDALSAVDARTEAAILQHIRADRHGKTTMIVAQRLSSVINADQIIVLDHGQIIQRGTHSELLAQSGWYQDMFKRQQLANQLDEGGN